MLENVQEVTVFPPVNACADITDEDSGEEDVVQLDNLPGSQLRAPAEIKLNTGSTDDFSSDDDLPLSTFVQEIGNSIQEKKTKKKKIYEWVKQDIVATEQKILTQEGNATRSNPRSPLEYFYDFFDNSIIQKIVLETNRYVQQRNRTQTVTDTEIRAFIGVLVLSGYVPVPRRKMFWERERDANNKLVTDSIPRDKFDFIMSNIHLQDNNNLDSKDRFAKVRPLFDHLKQKCLENGRFEPMHSVDEAMVPYYGRHGAKQFMKGKPIRYGYKLWVGTSRLGYIYWFEPYQGAATNISTDYAKEGVGAGAVLEYARTLRKKWSTQNIHLFFDNFFTSMSLLEILTAKGFYATGTVRENRLPGNPLEDKKIFKKKARGSYDFKKIADQNIIAVKWNDNSLVTLCSNYAGVEPLHNVKRYSRKEKQNVQVSSGNNSYLIFCLQISLFYRSSSLTLYIFTTKIWVESTALIRISNFIG